MATSVRPSEITYGPAAIVAAKPIQSKSRSTVTLTEAQRANMARSAADRNEQVESTIAEVYRFAESKAQYLSQTCGHKPDYYLRLIFSGGASLQKKRKPNAYNAWSHQLAKDKNGDVDPGEATNLLDLQRQHREEYDQLTLQQKRDLCEVLEEERDSRSFGIRVNQKGRAQDVMSTFRRIMDMLIALKCRCGIEAFVGLVRNNTEYELRPQWFFTSTPINRYLTGAIKKWDVEVIGSQFEAFSIAGCELFTFLRTVRDQAEWLKNEIRAKMNTLYADATGKKDATMHYKDYEKVVVIEDGLTLEGWTHEIFACPSSLPTTIEPLKKLRDALDNGECYFRRLNATERAERRRDYEEKLQAGQVATRKQRNDKGKTRKQYRRRANAEKETGRPRKRGRRDDQSDAEESNAESSHES
ncbi:hypothetical protein GSI_03026 [Ganoderma sinense ZZ0214-1]|uniref:Uncharacterized protein n=1 Tax=Ganoderma sinense ZZ0214-1 TaxID=1077348 RepID=A0A2G8SN92_9APHY|nr:hypothetical protein GSI_03026 [Ganoderma sinense ZZ0214-1]